MIINIYIGEQKLDLYSDENINLKSAIADVSDISKNTTEYTKTFTVPASDVNNSIFRHYYDFNIDNGFDARTKQGGRIELDGIPFKTGKFRLNKVSIKSGNPVSYSVNFWGELISFKDLLGDDKLTSLDLSAHDHTYNSDTVKGLFASPSDYDLVYALFSKKQLYFQSNGSDFQGTNIAFSQGDGVAWNELKPSLRLFSIIEAIEFRYDITFSRHFLSRSEFTRLYMLLDNSDQNIITEFQVNFDNSGDINTSPSTIDLTDNFYVNGYNSRVVVTITPSAGFEGINYDVSRKLNGSNWGTFTNQTGVNSFDFRTDLDTNEHTFFISVSEDFKFTFKIDVLDLVIPSSSNYTGDFSATMTEQIITAGVKTSTLMPDLKIIDFIRGLSQMFKWVIQPQDDGTIYINDINSYYAEGQVIDITRYVDNAEVEISRGEILNPINFNYKEPETILQKQFNKNNDVYFGDLELELTDKEDGTGDALDGKEFKIELPFEQILYSLLSDQATGVATQIVYAPTFDEGLNPLVVKPHIHYIDTPYVNPTRVGFINDLGVTESLNIFIKTPSYAIANNTHSTVWGNEQDPYTNDIIENTLYSNYYAQYISSIFNPKRRDSKYKVKDFPLRLLMQLSLNDVVQIRDNYYRIDSYDLNLINGDIAFNLINSFDNNINGFFASQTDIKVDFAIQTASTYVTNGTNIALTEVDTGDGVDWSNQTTSAGNVLFNFLTENNTGMGRTMQVTVTNNATLQEITITLTQTYKRVTIDNGVITADNNIITIDYN